MQETRLSKEAIDLLKARTVRRIIYLSLLLISIIVFSVEPSSIIKLVAIVLIIIFTEFTTFAYKAKITKLLLHRNKKVVPSEWPQEFLSLAEKMKVKVNKFHIVPGLFNAYTTYRDIFIGQTLLDKLSKEEILATVAHELSHRKGHHSEIKLGMVFIIFSLAYLLVPHDGVLPILAAISATALVLIPISWYEEIRADVVASRYVGKENMKAALRAISNQRDLKEFFESHPSTLMRIRWIDKS